MLSGQGSLSSDLYHNLIKEHNRLENNQRFLSFNKKSYNEELENLQLRLLSNTNMNLDNSEDPIFELKQNIESNIDALKKRILKMLEK